MRDVPAVQEAMADGVVAAGATLLSSSSHIFPGGGFTIVLLLAESHASIHTYPEHGSCFIDLFTCGESCEAEAFEQLMRARLCPVESDIQILSRGSADRSLPVGFGDSAARISVPVDPTRRAP